MREIRSEDPGIGGYKLWVMLVVLFGSRFMPGRDSFYTLLRRHHLMLPPRKTRCTTNSNHRYHKWKNLVKGFVLTSANQLWVSDITYIPLANGEVCYLHLVTDAYSHKVVGWVLAETLRASATVDALRQAIRQAVEMKGSEDLAGLTHHSDRGVQYCCDLYVASDLNNLLVNALLATGQLLPDNEYDFDFDHQFIETEKFDAKITYKKFTGYSPGIATVGDVIVGIENRDGNTNVRFHQEDTLKRIFERLENARIHINRARMDCGSCSEAMVEMVEKHSRHFYIRANRCVSLYDDIFALRGWKTEYINGHEFEICSIIAEKWVGKAYRLVIQRQRSINKELDLWEGEYTYRCILTNDYTSTDRDIVEYYNKRGGAERVLDDMNNGFGWKRLPKSFMAENTVFLLLTALIRNFYRHLISDANMKSFGLKRTSRIKTFVFKYVSVPAKWIKTARQHILNIYTSNDAYMMAFKFDFG